VTGERGGLAPSGGQFEISSGRQRAVVVEVGGGLRTYTADGHAVLDGYGLDELARSGRGQVLAPWPNRVEDGRYEFAGSSYQLALTEVRARNAIHGLVRWAAWHASDHREDGVVMEHVLHPQPGYPFTLSLRVEYVLSRAGLSVRTTARNLGPTPCPYGVGQHPYFTLGTSTVDPLELTLPAGFVFDHDERGLPVGSHPVDGTEHDFRVARTIAGTKLDHAFTRLERGDDGLARLSLRSPDGRGLRVWVDRGYEYLMVFTGDSLPDVARRSVAIEPMTCPPNSFRTGEALIRLEPGESFECSWGVGPA
jgi:aldose 1-epimerase